MCECVTIERHFYAYITLFIISVKDLPAVKEEGIDRRKKMSIYKREEEKLESEATSSSSRRKKKDTNICVYQPPLERENDIGHQ